MTSLLKQIDVHAQSQRLREVFCEKCQTQYAYVLERAAKGSATGMHFSRNDGASRRANEAALRLLDRMLDEQAELVPCPVCRWVNQDMVRQYRKQQHGFRFITYFIAWVVGFHLLCIGSSLVSAAVFSLLPKHQVTDLIGMIIMFAGMAAGLFMPLWMWLYVKWRRGRINPNRRWPDGPPVLPVGTPAALLPVDVDEDGQMVYEVVHQHDHDAT